MMRSIGFGLVLAGLCLSAGFGARLGESDRLAVEAGLQQQALDAAQGAMESPEDLGELERAALQRVVVKSQPAVPDTPIASQRMSDWIDVAGPMFTLGILMMVAGALMARRAGGASAGGAARQRVGFVDTCGRLREEIDQLIEAMGNDADPTTLRAQLDGMQAELIDPLVEERAAMVKRHGLGTFAEYFGSFSGAERQLHRAWSALADGYPEVALESLRVGGVLLQQAGASFERAEQRAG